MSNSIKELIHWIDDKPDWKALLHLNSKEEELLGHLLMSMLQLSWSSFGLLSELATTSASAFAKKRKILGVWSCRLWILMYRYLQGAYTNLEEEKDSLLDILGWVHDQLGRFSICGSDDGIP